MLLLEVDGGERLDLESGGLDPAHVAEGVGVVDELGEFDVVHVEAWHGLGLEGLVLFGLEGLGGELDFNRGLGDKAGEEVEEGYEGQFLHESIS